MKIIFNSSLPRSGSTLVQNILGQNPAFYVSPTSGTLELLYGARANYTDCQEFKAQDSDLMAKGFSGFCLGGLEGWYKNITDKQVIIDKSRGWIGYCEFIEKFIKNPKYIVCVRDLRSILASMERLYRENMDKVDKMEVPAQLEGITVHQRIAKWMSSPPVGLATLRIYDAIHRGNIKNMCVIRYEDLLSEPEKVLAHLYEYLEEPLFLHDLKNIPQITQERDSEYGVYGNHVIRNTLSKPETDHYKLLGETAGANIISQNKWFFDYFYAAGSRFY